MGNGRSFPLSAFGICIRAPRTVEPEEEVPATTTEEKKLFSEPVAESGEVAQSGGTTDAGPTVQTVHHDPPAAGKVIYSSRVSGDNFAVASARKLSGGDNEAKPAKDIRREAAPGSAMERHNVTVVGSGPNILLFSHGFGTNQKIWDACLEEFDLENEYTAILWDLMGAYSTNPEGFNFQRYSTLHGYADDLLEVLDELEVEELTYVGHSVSGMIGTIASIERPDIFKRLIFIGASPRYLDQPGYKGGFSVEMLDQVFAAMQENYQAWASGFSPVIIGEDVESPSVREFCRSLFLIRPDIAFSTLKTIFMSDMRSLLPQCKKQVHLLQTSRDAAVPWEPVEYMLEHFPNACVEMIPVAGHLPHLTHPKFVAEAILRHLHMPIRPLPASNELEDDSIKSGRVNGNGELLPVQ